jgi:hypothetical protein
VDLFFGINYGGGNGLGDGATLGKQYLAIGCVGVCFSKVSQDEADICASNQVQYCGPVKPEAPQCPGIFSTPQSCDEKCQEGPVHSFTVPAGFVKVCPEFGGTQQQADLVAKQIACDANFCGNDQQQVTLVCPDGSPFTFIVQAGQFFRSTRAIANLVALNYAATKASQNMICLSALTETTGCSGVLFQALIRGTTLRTSLTFSVSSGALPTGTALVPVGSKTVAIVGTPTAGDYTFSILATDPFGNGQTKQYTITIVGILTTSPLPVATVGVAYSSTILSDGPVAAPMSWLISGSLPAGLSFNTVTGEISGTPTTAQTSFFTIRMVTPPINCDRQFTLTVQVAVAACPSLIATIATSSLFQGVTAAKDAAVFRAITPNFQLGPTFGFFLVDTSNNTILLTDIVAQIIQPGCYAVTAARFCFMDGNGDFQLITTAGALLAPVSPANPSGSIPAYNSTDDVVYAASHDGANAHLIEFDANTNTINSDSDLGLADDAGNVWFCPTPKLVMIAGTTIGEVGVWTIPGLVSQGLLPGIAASFADGITYASSTGKIYASGTDPNPPFNDGLIYEINPNTLLVDFTYNLGAIATSIPLDYNPTNDRMYAVAGGNLVVIDPTARTIICTVAIAGGGGPVSVDQASQSIYTNDSAGQTLAFHH